MKRGKVADVTAGAHGGQRAGTGSHPGHRCTALNTSSAALSFGSEKEQSSRWEGHASPRHLSTVPTTVEHQVTGTRGSPRGKDRRPRVGTTCSLCPRNGILVYVCTPVTRQTNGPEFKTLLCKPLTRPSVNGWISRVVSTHSGVSRGLKNENYSDIQHR